MTCDLADNGQIALDLIRAAAPKDTPEEKYYKCILMDLVRFLFHPLVQKPWSALLTDRALAFRKCLSWMASLR
jgi:hypothetical protein